MGFWDVGPFDNSAALELVEDLRAGRFSLDVFRFRCAGSAAPDADDAAVVIALNALLTRPEERPAGIGEAELAEIDTAFNRSWLRKQAREILDAEHSSLYAHWEATGEAEEWVRATRGLARILR